jgi:hypothetical protein
MAPSVVPFSREAFLANLFIDFMISISTSAGWRVPVVAPGSPVWELGSTTVAEGDSTTAAERGWQDEVPSSLLAQVRSWWEAPAVVHADQIGS